MRKVSYYVLYGLAAIAIAVALVLFFISLGSRGHSQEDLQQAALILFLSSVFTFSLGVIAEAAVIYIDKNKQRKDK